MIDANGRAAKRQSPKKKNIFVVAKTKKRVEKLFIGNIKLPGKITIILFGVFTEFCSGIYVLQLKRVISRNWADPLINTTNI